MSACQAHVSDYFGLNMGRMEPEWDYNWGCSDWCGELAKQQRVRHLKGRHGRWDPESSRLEGKIENIRFPPISGKTDFCFELWMWIKTSVSFQIMCLRCLLSRLAMLQVLDHRKPGGSGLQGPGCCHRGCLARAVLTSWWWMLEATCRFVGKVRQILHTRSWCVANPMSAQGFGDMGDRCDARHLCRSGCLDLEGRCHTVIALGLAFPHSVTHTLSTH